MNAEDFNITPVDLSGVTLWRGTDKVPVKRLFTLLDDLNKISPEPYEELYTIRSLIIWLRNRKVFIEGLGIADQGTVIPEEYAPDNAVWEAYFG